MPNLLSTTDEFNALHEKHEHAFPARDIYSFRNLLWQIIVNDVRADEFVCLWPVHHEGELIVAIVTFNERGYHNTHVRFNKGILHDAAVKICDEMNEELFGITPKLGAAIVTSSMRNPGPKVEEEAEDEA